MLRARAPSPPEREDYCVVDPGGTSLRVLAAQVCRGEATVWGWAAVRHANGTAGLPPQAASGIEGVLAQAEAMAQSRGGEWFKADHLLVGLPASLLRGHASSVTQKRARPDSVVQENELEALLARTLRLAVNRLRGPEETDWLLLDAAPVALFVDDRGVTDPVGFRAGVLGASVSAVLAPAEPVQIWKHIAEQQGFSTLTLVATPMALTAVASEAECLLFDVGGGTTDLTWSRSRRPLAVNSLPIGGEAVTNSILRRWDLSPAKAERLKQAYAGRELGHQAEGQVLEAMGPALEAWLEGMETTLAQLQSSAERALPDRVYLLGGGSALSEFLDAARALAYSSRLSFARYPQMARLQPGDVTGVVNRTELGQSAGDSPALALAAWAAALGRTLDRPARILSELCDVQRA